MRNEPDLTPGEISDWLKEARRSREWLAEQTGSSTGTVAGWLATGRPRPIPVPTLRLIERLMCDDLLGEPQYTYAEAKVIRRAMTKEGYSSLRDFVKDAVMAKARRLLGENPGPSEVILRPPRLTVTCPSSTTNASRPNWPWSMMSVPAVIVISSPAFAILTRPCVSSLPRGYVNSAIWPRLRVRN